MLGFNNNKNAKPIYDYYVETDLDDQPVDYSKKFSDQESYDECRRSKSILKSSELPSEVSQTLNKQSCNDEVKVYCIEGTPLTISYASSLSDLREVGTNCPVDKSEIKDSFPSVNEDACSDSFDSKKYDELLDSSNEEPPLSKEKEDVKEGKSVSFRNSTDISKASSPLMFSRSSSIGSLTSLEQQSIVDDRSSVSVFSAFTSGLISPSDLPDSPGELMSPILTDKDSISKADVTKVDSDNECENIELSEKNEVSSAKNLLTNVENDIMVKIQLPESKVHVPLDSNKNSEEDNEVVAHQLETSNDSLDEVFENPDYENNPSFSLQNEEELSSKSEDESDDDDILLQQCIELGMPSNSSKSKQDLKLEATKDTLAFDVNVVCEKEEPEKSIIQARVSDSPKDILVNISNDSTEIESNVKSDEDSDEDDELLQRCIELGMPENGPNRNVATSEVFVKPVYPSQSTSYTPEKVLENQVCAKSDDNLDVDDVLLQQCIELGMPKKSPKNVVASFVPKAMESHMASGKPNNTAQQYPFKDRNKSYQSPHPNTNNVMPSSYQQYGIPPKVNYNVGINTKPLIAIQPSPEKKVPKNVYRKPYALKSDADSDCDENDLLLQHVIQMGMPKEYSEKKSLQSGVPRKPEFDPSQFIFQRINDMRDNCPDGVSDGDEDDAILEKCIRAGMPSPKMTHNVRNRLPILHTRYICQKQQMAPRSLPSGICSESSKKNICRPPPNQPYAPVHSNGAWISNTSFIDVDSMRIYRTEDTPVLSPTLSVSDLSSLSINESFLNNSRNSDCSSDSDDDDELLQQCIRSGMPEAKRAVA